MLAEQFRFVWPSTVLDRDLQSALCTFTWHVIFRIIVIRCLTLPWNFRHFDSNFQSISLIACDFARLTDIPRFKIYSSIIRTGILRSSTNTKSFSIQSKYPVVLNYSSIANEFIFARTSSNMSVMFRKVKTFLRFRPLLCNNIDFKFFYLYIHRDSWVPELGEEKPSCQDSDVTCSPQLRIWLFSHIVYLFAAFLRLP